MWKFHFLSVIKLKLRVSWFCKIEFLYIDQFLMKRQFKGFFFILWTGSYWIAEALMKWGYFHVNLSKDFLFVLDMLTVKRFKKRTSGKFGIRNIFWSFGFLNIKAISHFDDLLGHNFTLFILIDPQGNHSWRS